ncbi:hypothetical protein SDC9_59802 [bioreactor metagenome]|uniref:Uncharacterized protein n=1 Tax=bioreactor metagenome TaxID=1076179 RepID=A0A644XB66_9ZZZZ
MDVIAALKCVSGIKESSFALCSACCKALRKDCVRLALLPLMTTGSIFLSLLRYSSTKSYSPGLTSFIFVRRVSNCARSFLNSSESKTRIMCDLPRPYAPIRIRARRADVDAVLSITSSMISIADIVGIKLFAFSSPYKS